MGDVEVVQVGPVVPLEHPDIPLENLVVEELAVHILAVLGVGDKENILEGTPDTLHQGIVEGQREDIGVAVAAEAGLLELQGEGHLVLLGLGEGRTQEDSQGDTVVAQACHKEGHLLLQEDPDPGPELGVEDNHHMVL